MEIKNSQINKILLLLNCVYFVKSVGATLNKNFEFDYAKGKASSNRNMEGNSVPKYEINMFISGKQENSLTENKNQIELKKQFLINDTITELVEKLDFLINSNMDKLGVKINTLNQMMLEMDPLINDKMEEMKENITINIFSLMKPKIDSVINDTVIQLEGKINTLNSLMLNINTLLSDKMKQMEENITKNIFNRLDTQIEKLENKINTFNRLEPQINSLIMEPVTKLEEKIKLIDHSLKDVKCYSNNTPRGCHYLKGCDSGIYSIINSQGSNKAFLASCDLKTLGGGWTVIQRRQDGSENFYKTWNAYVMGFGDVKGEFFIGLEKLFALTSLQEPQELYIMMEDWDGVKRYARYGEFKIDSESTAYKLTVGQFSGNASDNFSQHNGEKFSTRDRDNDKFDGSCAQFYKGSWWYNSCFNSNLNGLYLRKAEDKTAGVSWGKVNGSTYLLKFVQMMIRPKEN